MKLGGEDVVTPDGRGKHLAILGARRHDGFIHRLRIKAVDEINVTAVVHTAKERAIAANNLNLVPADLRIFRPCFSEKRTTRPLKTPNPAAQELNSSLF